MGDKKVGGKCNLKETFSEVEDLLSEKTDKHEVKSKIMNRRNIKENTGCTKTFELCQVLQDPECPEDVTIIKESFLTEYRDSSKAPDNAGANKSNRIMYCKEIVKPYIKADDDNVCEDELVCDALEAAAAEFPTFTFCSQTPEKPCPVEHVDQEDKKSSDESKCVQPCFKKTKVSPVAVLAVSEKKQLYFTDKSKVCKKSCENEIKDTKLDSKKAQTKPIKQDHENEIDKCMERHSKAVTTLKFVAQDILTKAYTAVKTVCNASDNESRNTSVPNICSPEDAKPKKISFENLQNSVSCKITNLENKDVADKNTPDIFDKALTLTIGTANLIRSFQNIPICGAFPENIPNKQYNLNQKTFSNYIDVLQNGNSKIEADCYNYDGDDPALNLNKDTTVLRENTDYQYEDNNMSACRNSTENKNEVQKNTSDTKDTNEYKSEFNLLDENPCETIVENNVTVQSNMPPEKVLKESTENKNKTQKNTSDINESNQYKSELNLLDENPCEKIVENNVTIQSNMPSEKVLKESTENKNKMQKNTSDTKETKLHDSKLSILSLLDKSPCEKKNENIVPIQSNIEPEKCTKFDSNKLKFNDLDTVLNDAGKKVTKITLGKGEQIIAEKESTVCKSNDQEKVISSIPCQQSSIDIISKNLQSPCETVAPYGNKILEGAGKIAGSAYKTSANVVDVISEQKTYCVEKIKEHIDYIGTTLVEKKDSVSCHIGDLKDAIFSKTQEKKKDPFIDSYKDCKKSTISETLKDSLSTAKSTAKIIATTGVETIEKVCSSTSSLISNVTVKSIPSNEKVCEERNVCEPNEGQLRNIGIAKHLMTTISSTAERITKTLGNLNDDGSPYDVPKPNPKEVSNNFENSDDDLNLGVFDTLKSKLYSMFYDKGFSTVRSESSAPLLSTSSSRVKPKTSLIEKKP